MKLDIDAMQRQAEQELGITHRDGIPWHEAPLPPRWHKCSAWTIGVRHGIIRCACGAIAGALTPWMEKNARRPRRFFGGWRR